MITQEQERIINSKDDHILVVANAGCGKTFTIIERLNFLINEEGIDPKRILLTSFSKIANAELYEKVEKRLGNHIANNISIGTIHAFCYRIMQENLSFFGMNKIDIVSESYLSSVAYNQFPDVFDSKKDALKYSYVYRNELSRGCLFKDFSYPMREAFKSAQVIMEENNKLLYDDLMIKSLYLFSKKEEIRQEWSNKFDYIILDESQDTSKLQWDIVESLLHEKTKSMIVGDVKQNIYGFRGASYKFMNEYKDNHKSAVYSLSETFRYGENFAQVSNVIVDNLTEIEDIYRIKTKTNVKCENKPEFIFMDTSKQIDNIIQDIKSKNAEGYKYSDMNIVYRYNKESQEFVKRLIIEQIPFEVKAGDIFKRSEIIFIKNVCSLIDEFDYSVCTEVMKAYPNFVGDKTLNRIFREIGHIPSIDYLIDQFEDLQVDSIGYVRKKALLEFKNNIVITKNYLNSCKDKPSISMIAQSMNINQTKFMMDFSNEEGKDIKDEAWEFIEFFEESFIESEFNSVNDWYEFNMLNHFNFDGSKKDAVQLKTIHGCKGQSLPIVYLLLNRVADPMFIDEDKLLDEKFVLYVATTRAEKYFKMYINDVSKFRFNFIFPQEFLDNCLKQGTDVIDSKILEARYNRSMYKHHFTNDYKIVRKTEKAIMVSNNAKSFWIPLSAASMKDNKIYVLDWIVKNNKLENYVIKI